MMGDLPTKDPVFSEVFNKWEGYPVICGNIVSFRTLPAC
jgi:hypothetical protein